MRSTTLIASVNYDSLNIHLTMSYIRLESLRFPEVHLWKISGVIFCSFHISVEAKYTYTHTHLKIHPSYTHHIHTTTTHTPHTPHTNTPQTHTPCTHTPHSHPPLSHTKDSCVGPVYLHFRGCHVSCPVWLVSAMPAADGAGFVLSQRCMIILYLQGPFSL